MKRVLCIAFVLLSSLAGLAKAQLTLHYVHSDHLNTPRLVSDSTSAAVWKWDQAEPFGDSPPDENPSALGVFPFPLRFAGTYDDFETNGAYNYSRDLDRALGRYRQSDPIGLQGGLNTYLHVRANPLRYADPLGLQAIPVPKPPVRAPAPAPTPGIGNPSGGEVVPFPPGGRERPDERPGRPESRDRDYCSQPDRDPECATTGLAGFSAIGPYGGVLTCQYRCPRRGIQHLTFPLTFTPAEPRYLCRPVVPESIFR